MPPPESSPRTAPLNPAFPSGDARDQASPVQYQPVLGDSQGSNNSLLQLTSVPALGTTSSNVSTRTVDTGRTSPIDHSLGPSTDGSPMSVDPASEKRGFKRMASGVIKSSGSDEGSWSRHSSTERKQVRAIEVSGCCSSPLRNQFLTMYQLSAQLKTRLSYAMLKVQNGWETNSIDQLETLSSSRQSVVPDTPTFRPSRRPSVSSDVYLTSPIGQGSPSQMSTRILQAQLHGNGPQMLPFNQPLSNSPPALSNSVFHGQSRRPPLAPAPAITSPGKSRRRSTATRAPPSLSLAAQAGPRQSDLRGPSTPTNSLPSGVVLQPRPARNQAEQDAVETLLFMSSPGNSSNMKFSGASQSPVRARRVEFVQPGTP
jgi:hypothetical protein